MNEWERNSRMADINRKIYPPGTRIELINMDDPYAPVPAGTRGSVDFIDDQSQIFMKWDNGRSLPLNVDHDSFRKLTAKEIEAEQQTQNVEMDEVDSPVQTM